MSKYQALSRRLTKLGRGDMPPIHYCNPSSQPCRICEEYKAAGWEDRITMIIIRWMWKDQPSDPVKPGNKTISIKVTEDE